MTQRMHLLVPGLILGWGMVFGADGDPLLSPDTSPSDLNPSITHTVDRSAPAGNVRIVKNDVPPIGLGDLLGADQRKVLAPGAWWVRWEDYRTMIVIDAGGGLVRSAWVATYDVTTGVLAVAYRAQAHLSQDGVLHVVGKNAVISGPQAWQWSPDSFDIGADNQVSIVDDQHGETGNHGEVERVIDGRKDAATYRVFLRLAMTLVGGTS